MFLFLFFLRLVCLLVLVLLSVAFLTVLERKYLSGIQGRRGPNIVGFFGSLQAISDGLKLVVKESILPTSAERRIFWVSPCISFICSVLCWGLIPMSEGVGVFYGGDVRVLILLGISSIGVYGVILGGWGSNSKYALLGGLRSTGQMISYEVSLGFYLCVVMLYCGGVSNLEEIVWFQESGWNILGMCWTSVIWMILIVAETNRHPFDLPEAEAELVSGYNVEYSGGSFALYFLGEYSSIILMSTLSVMLFLGGYNMMNTFINESFWIRVVLGIIFSNVKVFVLLCVFIWLRASFPRYRFDQLIYLGWIYYLSIGLGNLLLGIGISYIL